MGQIWSHPLETGPLEAQGSALAPLLLSRRGGTAALEVLVEVGAQPREARGDVLGDAALERKDATLPAGGDAQSLAREE